MQAAQPKVHPCSVVLRIHAFGEEASEDETGCTEGCGTGGEGESCISLFQDCAAGLKCSPYWLDEDLGGTPSDFKCVPVHGSLEPGAACTLEDLATAIDDCDASSFCWTWGSEAIEGRCYPYCTGGFQYADCIEGWDCALPASEDPPMCVLECLPLTDDCAAGSECLWTAYAYSCVVAGAAYGTGEACELFNDCAADMDCLDAPALEGCAGERCCTPMCSLAEGDEPCQALNPSYACVAAVAESPSGAQDIGHCRLP